jgi:O-methyltransferase involved in polyketide biosynthesis
MAPTKGTLLSVGLVVLISIALPQLVSWQWIVSVFTAKGKDNHQDGSRAGVGSTAFAVSAARAMESTRRDREPITDDKVANAIFNIYQIESKVDWKWRLMTGVYLFKDIWPFRQMHFMKRLERIQDLVAIRTKYLDEEILNMVLGKQTAVDDDEKKKRGMNQAVKEDEEDYGMISSGGIKQLVIIGAGLDARVVRLPFLEENNVVTYELDFPAMFKAKWEMFEHYGFNKPDKARYVNVETDFSLGTNSWSASLTSSGFDPQQPAIWLVEGVTGYLEKHELIDLIDKISQLSAGGSYVLATFIGEEKEFDITSLHRFRTDDPCHYLKPFGRCLAYMGIGEIGDYLNVSPCSISRADTAYRIVKAVREK